MSPCVELKNVSKVYKLYRTPRDRLKELLGLGKHHREFWALRNINLEIHPGESLGIIGRNGSGKSTLLQIIAGTLSPTSGEVSRTGRIAALLELGIGFHPELTGRENIRMISSLMQVEWTKKLEEEIIEFAEIGEFIDQPVKTYSSGMFVRLAFSLASSVNPDILVVDEALSVGDHYFQKKSFERILSLKRQGKTLILCSHSMYHINQLCDKVVWLDAGSIKAKGPANIITESYERWAEQETKRKTSTVSPSPRGYIRLKLDKNPLKSPEGISLTVEYSSPFKGTHIGVCIYKGETPVIVTSTHIDGIPPLPPKGSISWKTTQLPLKGGTYTVLAVLLDETGNVDLAYNRQELEILHPQNASHYGILTVKGKWHKRGAMPP